jgi:CHAD domain-containing protein
MAKPRKVKKVLPADRIDKTAVRILRTRLKEFYSHWPDPNREPTPEDLHNLRISGKRLRYSAECLRELYPDQLTLLIDLFKRSQDLLGSYQDCIVQRAMIDEDLKRVKQRDGKSKEIAVLDNIIAEYDQRQTQIFGQIRQIWRGMATDAFRRSLKKMITNTALINNGEHGVEGEEQNPTNTPLFPRAPRG